MTSIAPQAYFVKRIGGDKVTVDYLIPSGAAPATYAPTPRQVVKLARSAIYVKIGHPNFIFEPVHIEPVLAELPTITVISMWAGPEVNRPEHGAEPTAVHSHGGDETDPHIWISPNTVSSAVKVITARLMSLDPDNAGFYQRNSDIFLDEIVNLDQEIRTELSTVQSRKFLVYHPVWGHFAREYDLEQVEIEAQGKEPSPAQLIDIIDQAKTENIKVIFVQQGFSRRSAEIIARETGGQIVELNPLEYDWLNNLRKVAQIFKNSLTND
ncbi:MAG: zinc ABC transporter substrate-binding protein [Candidatus Neomarinimicrobiota bacterium]